MTRNLLDVMDRRERLLRFIEKFYSSYERFDYAFRRYARDGIQIGFEDLTDATLERFADHLRREFWTSKRFIRENRAIIAKRKVA